MVDEYPQHRVADGIEGSYVYGDQGTGNFFREGEGIDLIYRIADGAFPRPFFVIIPGRVGIDLFFGKDKCVRDGPEILKNQRDRFYGCRPPR